MTELTIVHRSLRHRSFSTTITALSVGVAVALMLVLLSMRDAGRRAFNRGSGNMHLLVSNDLSPLVSVLNGVFYAKAPARALTWMQYERIRQDPRLAYAIPVQQGDSYMGFPVMATVPEFFERFSPDPAFNPGQSSGRRAWTFREGGPFTTSFQVVAGYRVWQERALKIGDRLHLTHGLADTETAHEHHEHDFEVVGLLAATGSPHDRAVFIHLESTWIIHAEERREREAAGAPGGAEPAHDGEDDHAHEHVTAADLTPEEKVITGVYLRGATREGSNISAVIPTVAAELRRDPRLTVAEPAAEVARLFRIVSYVDQILVAMALVVLVSSGISILLALYNTMEQRRRQIAVLRVLGCSPLGIARIVLLEAMAIGIFGAVLGVAVSVGGVKAVAAVMKRTLGVVVESSLPWPILAMVTSGAVLLAAVSGLIPAIMAYRTSVAKNLRPLG